MLRIGGALDEYIGFRVRKGEYLDDAKHGFGKFTWPNQNVAGLQLWEIHCEEYFALRIAAPEGLASNGASGPVVNSHCNGGACAGYAEKALGDILFNKEHNHQI